MDDNEVIEQLNKLKEWAYQLASDHSLSEDFGLWYKQVVDAIQNIFGADSEEMKKFNQINFRIDSNIIQDIKHKAETLTHQLEAVSQKDTKIQHFDSSSGHYYRERLYDAAETIMAMIIELRSHNKE
ncbi:MAG: hypothetical protein PHY72_01965 [Candidatus Pacebacteria bacterium]|nr:hypothetical protein [Candidatus Paceibacterota bacterium]